jgi:hypothetical protein
LQHVGSDISIPAIAQESQSQQADENARLRSTLEEWSLANRKLELEVARWRKAAEDVKIAADVQTDVGQRPQA